MKKKTANKLLLALSAASFLVAVLEGTIYYSQYEKTWLLQWLLILQNGVKAFLLSPDLSAEAVMSTLQDYTTKWEYTVGCAYVAAVFIAPLCTAAVVVRTIERILRQGAFRFRGRRAVLVYGWDATVEAMLMKWDGTEGQVYLVPGRELTEDKQLSLLRRGVSVCRERDELRAWERAGTIFLLDPSSSKNLSTHVRLQERWQDGTRKGAAPKVVCACEEEGIGSMVVAFHDMASKGEKGALPVTLYSMAELKVRSALEAHPLWEYGLSTRGDDCYDVHLLLVGFGQIGQRLLEQAISLSVLSCDSRISFHVVDRDAHRLLGFFQRRFAPGYVQVDREKCTISIPSGHADGTLTIHFHQLDVDDGGFRTLIKELNVQYPLTYGAICLTDPDAALRCLFQLDRVLREDGRPIPVAVRMDMSPEIARQLREEGMFYARVFPFCCETEALTLDHLASDKAYAGAITFNHRYDAWSAWLSGEEPSAATPEEAWRSLPYFKQASSLAQYQHQATKAALLAFEQARPESFQADPQELALLGEPPLTGALAVSFARLEHRRWCYYMASVGWGYGDKKDEDRKLNPCMVPWDVLCRERPHMCPYDTTPYRMLLEETGGGRSETK